MCTYVQYVGKRGITLTRNRTLSRFFKDIAICNINIYMYLIDEYCYKWIIDSTGIIIKLCIVFIGYMRNLVD